MNAQAKPLDELDEDDARLFELLEHPEAWPNDPALQAELAELLELHLALHAHKESLPICLPIPRRRIPSWFTAAAAALILALVPSIYAVTRAQNLAKESQNLERIAMAREQERAWIAFFEKSSMLIQDFEQHAQACKEGEEGEEGEEGDDRSIEREAAQNLLQASYQLSVQGSRLPEAEGIRNTLHAWLSEIAFEDACLSPGRLQELRNLAETHSLGTRAERMGRRLQGEAV